MKGIYINFVVVLVLCSCRSNNQLSVRDVRDAIIKHDMISSFRNYESIVARDVDYYMVQMRNPIYLYVTVSMNGSSYSNLAYSRDSLLRRGVRNPDKMVDSVMKEIKKIVRFMSENSIKNFFSDKIDSEDFTLTFAICNDEFLSCKEYESLSYHNGILKSAVDTVIVDSSSSEKRTFKQLDSHWSSLKVAP